MSEIDETAMRRALRAFTKEVERLQKANLPPRDFKAAKREIHAKYREMSEEEFGQRRVFVSPYTVVAHTKSYPTRRARVVGKEAPK